MRKKLVVGNWKMHGDVAFAQPMLSELITLLPESMDVDLAVCPPYPFLSQVQASLVDTPIALGAQDVSSGDAEKGAFTGEVSASMLAGLDCAYVIVGHSERRERFDESNATLAKKIEFIQQAKMMPILCVGETLASREAGNAESVVASQLSGVIDLIGVDAFKSMVVAYEPVWAIGTGKTATPDIAQTMHAHIRQVLASFDAVTADTVQLLYGGSVKPENAAQLFSMADIDGALVGGASLDAESFSLIAQA